MVVVLISPDKQNCNVPTYDFRPSASSVLSDFRYLGTLNQDIELNIPFLAVTTQPGNRFLYF